MGLNTAALNNHFIDDSLVENMTKERTFSLDSMSKEELDFFDVSQELLLFHRKKSLEVQVAEPTLQATHTSQLE